MAFPLYRIGTSVAGLESLAEVGVEFLPKADAVDYAVYVENGDGELVGQGWLVATWRFAALPQDQAALLEAYEGECYIQTLEQDGDYGIYSALMVRQPRRAAKGEVILDYVCEFRKLVVQT